MSLGVKEMNESEDMTADLSQDATDDDIILKAMEILEIYKAAPSKIQDYYDKPIFLAKDNDGRVCRACAFQCCWSVAVAFFYPHNQYILMQESYEILPYLVASPI